MQRGIVNTGLELWLVFSVSINVFVWEGGVICKSGVGKGGEWMGPLNV